eukprot:TRINITY_DN24476_c0_g1_i1.p1 TRINITY_DN24476_c0_g1~~TRINITY_DN24476_c0_g1_i1.p1  ORF type:complete len:315 (+),score=39.15 TRINITY_DN24476_c0_g1_i1:68-946(+)
MGCGALRPGGGGRYEAKDADPTEERLTQKVLHTFLKTQGSTRLSFVSELTEGSEDACRVVFFDAVIIGPNASVACRSACDWGNSHAKGSAQNSYASGAARSGKSEECEVVVPRSASREAPSQSLSCYCKVDDIAARVKFWVLERWSQALPIFPASQSESVAYIVLLPIGHPKLEDCCSDIDSRLQEMHLSLARAASQGEGAPLQEGDTAVYARSMAYIPLMTEAVEQSAAAAAAVDCSSSSSGLHEALLQAIVERSGKDLSDNRRVALTDAALLYELLVEGVAKLLLSREGP